MVRSLKLIAFSKDRLNSALVLKRHLILKRIFVAHCATGVYGIGLPDALWMVRIVPISSFSIDPNLCLQRFAPPASRRHC
ncbi:hypothetical protein D3C79_954380 [compost metagenome]